MDEAGLRQLARDSISAVGSVLESEASTIRLNANQLARYSTRSPVAGWRVALPLPSGRSVDVLLRDDFPWSAPLMALVDRPPFLEWPHLEHDGVLCLLGSEATIDAFNPVGVVRYLLMEVVALVEKLEKGQLTEDFRDEFQSYWSWSAEASAGPAISLCRPDGPSREVRCWIGERVTLLADDDETIIRWLNNRGRDPKAKAPVIASAVLAFLPAPPLPSEYPTDGSSLISFLKKLAPEAANLICDLAAKAPDEVVVAICARTERGPTLAAVVIPKPRPRVAPGFRGADPIQKGFRPGRVPVQRIIQRFMSGNTALRLKTERADPAWIHGRDNGGGFDELRDAHVAFVGCGSVGSPAIRLLVQAGLGKVTIVDPDRLGWANLGRHALGSADVGAYKAVALADSLRRDFPHIISAAAITQRIEQLLLADDVSLRSADVIVSTTGNWSANAALHQWTSHLDQDMRLLIGWTEAHACAGHAVVLIPPDGCIHCGFERTGVPRFRVTEWDGEQLRQEPACGASYQPYGPIDASLVATMIADAVLDVLLGEITSSTHRVWAARKRLLVRNGGRWSADWLSIGPHVDNGGLMVERAWPRDQRCAACQRDMAA